jgi:hypothetical protein
MSCDLSTLLAAEAARAKLWAIPGVRRIGFGHKEQKGQILSDWVFRVYVDEKRPLDQVEPTERVPSIVDGIGTDVIALGTTIPECTRGTMNPGDKISREAHDVSEEGGSIGCFVRRALDGGGTGVFLLSNDHVLYPGVSSSAPLNIFHPELVTFAGVQCNSPISTLPATPIAFRERKLVGSKLFYLDCALARLVDKLKYENVVPDATFSKDLRDLSGGAASLPTIRKLGATTGKSRGTITEVAHERDKDDNSGKETVFELRCVAVEGPSYEETYELAASEDIATVVAAFASGGIKATPVDPLDPANRKVRFKGVLFSRGGDSGSVWYDDTGKLVGLHYAGDVRSLAVADKDQAVEVPMGIGWACHITAVFDALAISQTSGLVIGASTTAGRAVAVPVDVRGASVAQSMTRIERALDSTPYGRELRSAFQQHFRELSMLVHHRRPVTVVWHRNKGPQFVAACLSMLREGRDRLPAQLPGGHRLLDLLVAMRDILIVEGSLDLRATIERHAERALALVERSTELDSVLLGIGSAS